MNARTLSIWAGASYFIIFFAAIFANFYVIEAILREPVLTIKNSHLLVRWGIMAFMVTVVFDVVVAWALNELYKFHSLSVLSMLFRMMHAAIMAVAIFALVSTLSLSDGAEILKQVNIFNTIWLIGLFFFGVHLILLGKIMTYPRWITWFLILAGNMYIIDTTAHFVLPDYSIHAPIFLVLVAIPSIVGEMSLAVWLLVKGGKE